MKVFAVIPALLASCAAEASLPIAAPYLSSAGLYNGVLAAGAYAAPYASYVDAKFAYGAPITALNAGPVTAGPVYPDAPAIADASVADVDNVVAAAPATYAAAYTDAPAPIAVNAAPAAYAAAPAVAAAPLAAAPAVTAVAAAAPVSGPVASQFQAQDEFGNVAYGYQNINSAKQERGNALGGVTGSYTYADEAGVHTVNYIADDFGFRVAGDNLPVAPVYSGLAPAAPVYNGVAPLPVADTPEVAAAKASFFEAYNAAAKVKRSADADAFYNTYAAAPALSAYAPYNYAAATYAAAPAVAAVAPATYATAPVVAAPAVAAPAVATYAAAPAVYAAAPAVATATYAAAPAVAAVAPAAYAATPAVAAVAPAAYAAAPVAVAAAPAAPAREAVLTTIKLNPGHAVAYRVD